MWFVKVRRAQNDQDFETWKQGGGGNYFECYGQHR